jgi:hypothetical protein
LLQTLVELVTQGQALQFSGPNYIEEALIEISAKEYAFDRAWQGHILQALVEVISKRPGCWFQPPGNTFSRLGFIL